MNVNPQKLIWKLPSLLAALLLVLGFTLSAATCHLEAANKGLNPYLSVSPEQLIAQSICSTLADAEGHQSEQEAGHDCEQCLHMQVMLSTTSFDELPTTQFAVKAGYTTPKAHHSQTSPTLRLGRAPPKTV